MKRWGREDGWCVALIVLVLVGLVVLQGGLISGGYPNLAESAPGLAPIPGVTSFGGVANIARDMVTVGNDGVIPAVGSYQPISSTAAVGTALVATRTVMGGAYPTTTLGIAPIPSGMLLYLVNIGSQTITITDTGTNKLTGNIALGQYDTLELMFDGTNWLQLTTANN